jgi:hypothetical protein
MASLINSKGEINLNVPGGTITINVRDGTSADSYMTNPNDNFDLVVRFDATANQLVCFAVQRAHTQAVVAGAPVFEMELADLQGLDADETERAVGGFVLDIVSTLNGDNLKLPAYSEKSARAAEELDRLNKAIEEDLKARAVSGDVEAKFSLALKLYKSANDQKSFALIEEADTLISEAAAGGNAEAAGFLSKEWPVLKSRAEKEYK